jgi:hypothetical protein
LRRILALCLAVFAASALVGPARAAEKYVGTIVVTDAGAVHNLFPTDGGAFYIAPNSLITVQPSVNAYICVDELTAAKAPTCSTTVGVLVPSGTAFPSSCASATAVQVADGGFVQSCTVTCLPASGASVNCPVWVRKGNES